MRGVGSCRSSMGPSWRTFRQADAFLVLQRRRLGRVLARGGGDPRAITRSFIILLLLCAFFTQGLAAEYWGEFKGDIIATFLPDGRNVRIERSFSYIDPRGRAWDVPEGMITDGASVPRFFWTAFPPFTGLYRTAAFVHDHYCQVKSRSWKDTHEAFYNAMRASDVDDVTALAMYGAVYYFGPRWGIGAGTRGPGAENYHSDEEQEAFFRELRAWIDRERPDAAEVARRLDQGGFSPR